MANVSGAKVSAPHTLFYSKRCPHSKNFLEKLVLEIFIGLKKR